MRRTLCALTCMYVVFELIAGACLARRREEEATKNAPRRHFQVARYMPLPVCAIVLLVSRSRTARHADTGRQLVGVCRGAEDDRVHVALAGGGDLITAMVRRRYCLVERLQYHTQIACINSTVQNTLSPELLSFHIITK